MDHTYGAVLAEANYAYNTSLICEFPRTLDELLLMTCYRLRLEFKS